ncbi:Bro-N domain-containing protein [Bacillus sp. FJAT-52991]|uniref:BRO family protein n=1 Tax=Bacillus kandeliae TaxID=3129297 RepID=A0ABZ2NA13_9BACI
MNSLQKVFHYSDNQIRTISINDDIWFVAKDVCDVLEIGNPSETLKRLAQDEKALISTEGFRGPVNVVNEYGFIFTHYRK